MPRREPRRRTVGSNIEVLRDVIRAGIPWLPADQHKALTPRLTDEQRALLANLTPYKSAMKFLSHCQPGAAVIEAARKELKNDIEEAKSAGEETLRDR
jgi:hypothetical protein